MHDAVSLQMLGTHGQLGADLVPGGEGDGDAHGLKPAFGHLVESIRKVLSHRSNPSVSVPRPKSLASSRPRRPGVVLIMSRPLKPSSTPVRAQSRIYAMRSFACSSSP